MTVNEKYQPSSKRVGIVAANNSGYVEAMFACLESGIVAVPLRDENDDYRINAAGVEEVITPTAEKSWLEQKLNLSATDDIALISFTSGTEGNPKGVVLTHKNLANVVKRLNTLMEVDDSIREYVGVPVYHSFGFGRCRAVASAGGKFFIPSNGFNPSEIGEMLKSGEINAISTVPSLWRVLLANQDLVGKHGRKVRWIEIGSQYMSRSEKEQLKALFPCAKIVQHYGLTEASRSTLLEVHKVEGELLESVGQGLGGIELKLTEEGKIAIRGDHVAEKYIIDGQAAPIKDPEGWLITKDLGLLQDGYLYYKGRADDVINCGGIKVPPEALETKIYASIGYGNGLAICRKSDPLRGEGFLLAVTKELDVDRRELKEVAIAATQDFGVNAANAITIVEVDSLPKTASGKVQRRKLSEWYAKEHPQTEPIHQSKVIADTEIQQVFYDSLNIDKVQLEDTFISLGGDSLSYIQTSMKLERYLGYLPPGWEEMTISQLESLKPKHQNTIGTIETNILLRAFGICGVVINHASFRHASLSGLDTAIAGGSYLMLLIAGSNLARFQGQGLLAGQFMQSINSLFRNLLIPYLAIVWLFQLYASIVNLPVYGDLNIPVLLGVSNFLDPGRGSVFMVWFIQVLLQLIVFFLLLLSVPQIRKLANLSPWKFGLGIFGLGVWAYLLIPNFWLAVPGNPNDLRNDHLPHMFLWLFAIGWCVHFAKSKDQKIVTSMILAIALLIMPQRHMSMNVWILVGGMMVLWQPYVYLPKILKQPIQMISAASYSIYVTHMASFVLLTEMTGIEKSQNIPTLLLHITFALVVGIVGWWGIEVFQKWMSKVFAQKST